MQSQGWFSLDVASIAPLTAGIRSQKSDFLPDLGKSCREYVFLNFCINFTIELGLQEFSFSLFSYLQRAQIGLLFNIY